MCPYSELFWSAFSIIRTEYGEIRIISPYSVRMRENADQNNSKYRHFSRSVYAMNINIFIVNCIWYRIKTKQVINGQKSWTINNSNNINLVC